MIKDAYKEKPLALAREHKGLSFEDVVYTDETTVQNEPHRRTCCYRKRQKPLYKPKPKHHVKVHVWAEISHRGRTNLCIFEGKMNAPLFISILRESLVPFIRAVMGIASCRIMTPSIVQGWLSLLKESGPLHPSHLISTQSRTYGTS